MRLASADTHLVWREFEQNEVTHSVAHHLMAVAALRDQAGYARITDVAELLCITRGSVATTFKNLEKLGLVERDRNGFLQLTEKGRFIAESTRIKRLVLQRFLHEILGVGKETALIDTCKIEHLISVESASRLYSLMELVDSGDSTTQEFLQTFNRFLQKKSHDIEECPICIDRCVLDT